MALLRYPSMAWTCSGANNTQLVDNLKGRRERQRYTLHARRDEAEYAPLEASSRRQKCRDQGSITFFASESTSQHRVEQKGFVRDGKKRGKEKEKKEKKERKGKKKKEKEGKERKGKRTKGKRKEKKRGKKMDVGNASCSSPVAAIAAFGRYCGRNFKPNANHGSELVDELGAMRFQKVEQRKPGAKEKKHAPLVLLPLEAARSLNVHRTRTTQQIIDWALIHNEL